MCIYVIVILVAVRSLSEKYVYRGFIDTDDREGYVMLSNIIIILFLVLLFFIFTFIGALLRRNK